MRTYKEEQRFSQWWLYAILIAVMGGLFVEIYTTTSGFTGMDNNWPSLFIYLFVVSLLFGIISMKLKTKIDETGIKAQFRPFSFFSRKYSWNEIEECYVRKYSPFTEYGG